MTKRQPTLVRRRHRTELVLNASGRVVDGNATEGPGGIIALIRGLPYVTREAAAEMDEILDAKPVGRFEV